jgi:hypothetical protein
MNFKDAREYIEQNYQIIEYVEGHYKHIGRDSGIMKNPMWKTADGLILMYCETNTICKLCQESYNRILLFEQTYLKGNKLTWFCMTNGYIASSNKLFMHQIITGCYGNGKGTSNVSVDHIDQNPLNNTWQNLRIATRKEQEQNSKGIKPGTKRARKTSAKQLPEGLTQNMMKKYVVYYHEYLNAEKTRFREFFKIEKHPKLEKAWIGTKSGAVSIQDKLLQANAMIENIENKLNITNK